MKRKSNINIILSLITVSVFISYSCNNKKTAVFRDEKTIIEQDSLIGKWRFTEIQFRKYEFNQKNKTYERGLISRSAIKGKDSLVIEFQSNNFKINSKLIGAWKIKGDKLDLNGNGTFERIPLFLNLSYKISLDRYCWYLTSTFFSQNGIHHEVRYTLVKYKK
jgi:hypothetical protein